MGCHGVCRDDGRFVMSAESYEMFRMLIKEYKNSELTFARFCEIAEEFGVESSYQVHVVNGISMYLEGLPSNNNSDVKSLDFDEKSELAEQIAMYINEFSPED
jgi:hypothetical protein